MHVHLCWALVEWWSAGLQPQQVNPLPHPNPTHPNPTQPLHAGSPPTASSLPGRPSRFPQEWAERRQEERSRERSFVEEATTPGGPGPAPPIRFWNVINARDALLAL